MSISREQWGWYRCPNCGEDFRVIGSLDGNGNWMAELDDELCPECRLQEDSESINPDDDVFFDPEYSAYRYGGGE